MTKKSNEAEEKKVETKKEEKKEEKKTTGDFSAKDVDENKAITFLSYIGVLALVPLLAKKDSEFAQFHAKQGTVLFVSWFVASYVAGVVPFVGHALVLPAVSIFGIVLTIMGLINVANGAKKELPVIGDLAKKIKL
jgi:uncharacterized membrane protein